MIGAQIKRRLGGFGRKSGLSEIVHRLDQAWYKTPSPFFEPVSLDGEGQRILDSLREKGIAVVPGRFAEIAIYLRETYVSALEAAFAAGERRVPGVHRLHLNPTRPTWVERPYVAEITLADPELAPLFFDPTLLGVLTNYFRRQAYHRNYPQIVKTEHTDTAPANPQGKFHVDGGLGQVSFMFLLHDLDESQTHMQYALGSHRRHVPYRHIYNRWAYEDGDIARRYECMPLVGEAGTLFLFDAAHGFHRAVYKKDTVRVILHMNFSTGAFIPPDRFDARDAFAFLESEPPHVRHSVDKIVGQDRS